ncbi:SOS response-associated peptidase [Rhizobium ruizarguesonis]|uniref:SOS response-associated peptidase n=1 Tax=Rhizobium ruizarguesonis TaxID=2081791 RepID=UPI00103149D7|nr:SOS response-associated peptidase [Rhizobium ruizarguesonis]TBD47091.1 SOS response-associated peptidase [Rhizobium ruizarguesonis]
MCGRFSFEHEWPAFVDLYDLPWDVERGRNTRARFNIAPTQDVLIVHNDADGRQKAEDARWWLVPFWAKELPKATMFNARIETVETAPAFREAFKSKRCLIPASAFYEWTLNRSDGKKDPWHIHLPGDAPFSFAGIWARNDKLGLTNCSIVTMPAGDPMRTLHDRQPVILDPSAYKEWLASETPAAKAKDLLRENLDDKLEFHRVSREVNSSRFEGKPLPEVNPL